MIGGFSVLFRDFIRLTSKFNGCIILHIILKGSLYKMKKILVLMLALMIAVCFCGCLDKINQSTSSALNSGKTNESIIVTDIDKFIPTETPIAEDDTVAKWLNDNADTVDEYCKSAAEGTPYNCAVTAASDGDGGVMIIYIYEGATAEDKEIADLKEGFEYYTAEFEKLTDEEKSESFESFALKIPDLKAVSYYVFNESGTLLAECIMK